MLALAPRRGVLPRISLDFAPTPLATFVVTRGLVWLTAVATYLVARPDGHATADHGRALTDVGWPVDLWSNWDGGWYLSIAQHGYARPLAPAFFPLYPYTVRGAAWVVAGHFVLAGILVSVAAALAAFVLLHRLTAHLAGRDVANRAVLYLAIFPTAIFFQAMYAESLFLLLAVATFLLAERHRLVWAGGACGLAMLTRAQGVAVLLALVVFALRQRDVKRGVGSIATALSVFSAYPILLWAQRGDPLAFGTVQQAWGRHFSAIGPLFAPLVTATAAVNYGAEVALHGPTRTLLQRVLLETTFTFLALVVFVALLLAVRRAFGVRSPYFVYSAASLALPLFSPRVYGDPLMSLPRLGVVVFPLFIALALVGRESTRGHRAYVLASTTLLAIASATFAVYGWVS